MTRKEMTEVFSVMMLAWPNAEMFKGGIEKLGPTISLWTTCLSDVDFWTAQQAVLRLCKECKFPPSIAEFREKVSDTDKAVLRAIDEKWNQITMHRLFDGGIEGFIESLPEDSHIKIAIRVMGGTDALYVQRGDMRFLNYDGFKAAYTSLIRKDPALGGGTKLALGSGRKE